ncbi:hypothetical protein JM93_01166 [Roseibium hamelinense]|uniref:Uncharacterized protein n=1 Tax=Roseibium hamelinense TaxID=150831 RepID=A0A562T999_9HYPH|nr:hypothetical protein [Roseibium hamelinense]MTI45438.1 hypothetical protein [Roseibium hamelinense]TWI90189.1 hypothetical protein JM93_01166 [Roseibium hamelinense]
MYEKEKDPENVALGPNCQNSNQDAVPHAYFFVPAGSDPSCDRDDLGAILRLGEYSDLETMAAGDGHLPEYYPDGHISDAKNCGLSPTLASCGENDHQKGILLACDGRILVKNRERMYVQSKDYIQETNGDYSLSVDGALDADVSGDVEITSKDGQMSLSAPKGKVTISSGENQDIVMKAGAENGSGTGIIHQTSRTLYKEVEESEHEVSEEKTEFTKGKASNFFLGGKFSFLGDTELEIRAGGLMDMGVLHIMTNLIHVNFGTWMIESAEAVTEFRTLKTETNAIETKLHSISSDVSALQTRNTAMDSSIAQLCLDVGDLNVAVSNADARLSNVWALL